MAAPGKHYNPRAKMSTDGSASRQRPLLTGHTRLLIPVAYKIQKIFTVTVGISRVKPIV